MMSIYCCIPLVIVILQLVHWVSLDFLLLYLGISILNAFPDRIPDGSLSLPPSTPQEPSLEEHIGKGRENRQRKKMF
jgi:hypothetical protein